MKLLKRILLIGLGWSVLFAVSGCQMPPVAETVQRGSTIVVPLNNYQAIASTIGFGGSQVSDPQRGELQYFLVDPSVTANPPDLDDSSISFKIRPRGSGVAATAPASESYRDGIQLSTSSTLSPLQVISVLDIPLDAPPGKRVLWVRHLKPDGTTEAPAEVGDIWILPQSVSFSENGTNYTVVGTSTPFTSWGGQISSAHLQSAVPDPVVMIPLPTPVYAAEILVTMANATDATLVDAVLPFGSGLRKEPLVNVSSSPPYFVVNLVSNSASGLDELDLVVHLNGSTPIDPDPAHSGSTQNMFVTFEKAWDQDGNTILDSAGLPLYDGKRLAALNITPSVR